MAFTQKKRRLYPLSKRNSELKLLKSIVVTCAALFLMPVACTQSEVVVDKVIAKINEQIGKYDVQLKAAEKMLVKLKDAQRKAKINSKLSAKSGESYQSDVTKAQGAVDTLQAQLDKLVALETKGAPYTTSKGKKISKSKLNTLKVTVQTKLSVASAKLTAANKALQVSEKSKEGNAVVSDQLSLKIAQLEGKIEILKNNINLLNDMEEQRKLKSEYDSELAQGLLKEMDKTIAELDTIIEVDIDEVFAAPTNVDQSANNGLSNEDVDLIDEL